MKYINIVFVLLLIVSACDPDGTNSNSGDNDTVTQTDTTKEQTTSDSDLKKDNEWLCIPNKQVGLINADANEQSIIEAYGKENVVREEVGIGEGETILATIVFPKHPEMN